MAAAVALMHVLAHTSLTYSVETRRVADIGVVVAVSLFVFVLSYVELTAVRERRVRVMREARTIAELNHNIRNALQAIQYATHLSLDNRHIEIVTSAVDRIDNILHELFPVLKQPPKP